MGTTEDAPLTEVVISGKEVIYRFKIASFLTGERGRGLANDQTFYWIFFCTFPYMHKFTHTLCVFKRYMFLAFAPKNGFEGFG